MNYYHKYLALININFQSTNREQHFVTFKILALSQNFNKCWVLISDIFQNDYFLAFCGGDN